jgi:hypothetical protein
MRVSAFFLIGAFAIAMASGVSALQAAETETACKALTTEACTGDKGCSWVKPYKTKKGKEIAGFCRKKATVHSTKQKAPATAKPAAKG